MIIGTNICIDQCDVICFGVPEGVRRIACDACMGECQGNWEELCRL